MSDILEIINKSLDKKENFVLGSTLKKFTSEIKEETKIMMNESKLISWFENLSNYVKINHNSSVCYSIVLKRYDDASKELIVYSAEELADIRGF